MENKCVTTCEKCKQDSAERKEPACENRRAPDVPFIVYEAERYRAEQRYFRLQVLCAIMATVATAAVLFAAFRPF